MKSVSGDALSYNSKQLSSSCSHRRPRSADGHGQNRHAAHHGGVCPVRQTALQVPDYADRDRPASTSPAIGDRKRRPPVARGGRQVRVVDPSYYDAACPTARQRNDDPRYATEVFVVPSSPVSLPASAHFDRIVSSDPPVNVGHRGPTDDRDDVGSCDASMPDNDERHVSNRTIFDVVVRHRSLVAAVVCVFALLSPIVMVSIPRPSSLDDGDLSYRHRLSSHGRGYQCDEDCQSAFISLTVRLIVVAIGSLAVFTVFSPRLMCSAAEMPRLEDVQTTLTAFVFLVTVVFWSFYTVRVAGQGVYGDADYGRTVLFAGSMADTLLFVHGLAALVLGLRCRSTSVDIVVHVVLSPDGRSTAFCVSSMSIQQLALLCLRRCCVELDAESAKSGRPIRTVCCL